MFSPTTGILVVQGLVEGPEYSKTPYCVDTNIFEITYGNGLTNNSFYSSKNEFGLKTIDFDLSQQSGSAPGNYQYNVLNAYINGVNYLIGSTAQKNMQLNAFKITDKGSNKWVGVWTGPKTIQYSYDNMLNLDVSPDYNLPYPQNSRYNHYIKMVPNATGVYLISKQTVNSVPTLDISFISQDDLDGQSTTITPRHVYSFKNNDPSNPNCTPVPDSQIYDVMITSHMDTSGETLIGATDYQGSIVTWDIGPDGKMKQKTLMDSNTIKTQFPNGVRNLFLNEGSSPGDYLGGNGDISASVYEDTTMYWDADDIGKCSRYIYVCNLSEFETDNWNMVYHYSTTDSEERENYFMGKGAISKVLLNQPIINDDGSKTNLWTIPFFGVVYRYDEDDDNSKGHTFFLGYYPSNKLILNTTIANATTEGNINQTGNLFVPVAFIDGAPPINFNGGEGPCGSSGVESMVQLTSDNGKTLGTSGSVDDSASIEYGREFLHGKIGADVDLSASADLARGESTSFKETITKSFAMCEGDSDSYGWMLYLAPNLQTYTYTVADFYGNIPSSNAENIYVTQWNPNDPDQFQDQEYNITNPARDYSIFKGMMYSPVSDNFNAWNWTTGSGGWYNRDWMDNNPENKNYSTYTWKEIGSQYIKWNDDGGQVLTLDFGSSNDYSLDLNAALETSAAFLGLQINNTMSVNWNGEMTNTNDEGVTISYQTNNPLDDICGYDMIEFEPLLLTPVSGQNPPWVPNAYKGYEPWLITYDLLDYTTSNGCNIGSSAVNSEIHTSIIGNGTIILPSGGIGVNETGQVQAVPEDGYKFLHWRGFGIDVDDSTSPVTNVTVTAQYSTLRAYFAKQSSNLVDTSIISIQNGTIGNQVKIEGTLPSGFNRITALHIREPVVISIGDITFPFGPSVGDVNVVSDHEFAYTTVDSKKGISTLRIDLGTGKWWFAASNIQNLVKNGIDSNVVRISIGGKNVYVSDKVLMTGNEYCYWSGNKETINNDLFSLKNATMSGKLNYQSDESKSSYLYLNNGKLNVKSVNSTDKLVMRINTLDLEFSNATSVNGNVLTYQKTGGDLNATITVNNSTMAWDTSLTGSRISNNYIGSGLAVNLKIGSKQASALIHPTQITYLKTPNLEKSGDSFIPGMNFGA